MNKKIISLLTVGTMLLTIAQSAFAALTFDQSTAPEGYKWGNIALGKTVKIIGGNLGGANNDLGEATNGSVEYGIFVDIWNFVAAEIDLGSNYTISEVKFSTSWDKKRTLVLQGKKSGDADYTDIAEYNMEVRNSSAAKDITFDIEIPADYRYIKFSDKDDTNKKEFIIHELEIKALMPCDGQVIDTKPTLHKGDTTGQYFNYAPAFDGNESSTAYINAVDSEIILDLGKKYTLDGMKIISNSSYEVSQTAKIYTSLNATDWQYVGSYNIVYGQANTDEFAINPTNAKYVKFYYPTHALNVESNRYAQFNEIYFYGSAYKGELFDFTGLDGVEITTHVSGWGGGTTPDKMIDDDNSTYAFTVSWAKYIQIDLTKEVDIAQIEYSMMDNDYIKNSSYTITASVDGETFENIATISATDGKVTALEDIIKTNVKARYVRFNKVDTDAGQIGFNEIAIKGYVSSQMLGASGKTYPEDGATDVSSLTGSKYAIIDFTDDMDPTTLTAENIKLFKGNGKVTITGLVTSSKQVKFRIDTLESYTPYTVQLTKGIKKADQTEFDEDYVFSFTTGLMIAVEDGEVIRDIVKGNLGDCVISHTEVEYTHPFANWFDYDAKTDGYIYKQVNAGEKLNFVIDLGNWYDVKGIQLDARGVYQTDAENIVVKVSGSTSDYESMTEIATGVNVSNGVTGAYVPVNAQSKTRYVAIGKTDTYNTLAIGNIKIYVTTDAVYKAPAVQSDYIEVDEIVQDSDYKYLVNADAADTVENVKVIATQYNADGAMVGKTVSPVSIVANTKQYTGAVSVGADTKTMKLALVKESANGYYEMLSDNISYNVEKKVSIADCVAQKGSDLSDLTADGDLKIAYIGGSITYGGSDANGWATQLTAKIKEALPDVDVTTVASTGIGGTGSVLGVMRIAQDVIANNPEMVIIDCGVNDLDQSDNSDVKKQIEGIVNQLQAMENPPMILFVEFCNKKLSSKASIHKEVADHYGIPMIDMSKYFKVAVVNDTADLEEIFADDNHPSAEGQSFYANYFFNKLNTNAAKYMKTAEEKALLTPGNLLGTNKYTKLTGQDFYTMGAWTVDEYMEKTDVAYTETAGDELSFTFTGNALYIAHLSNGALDNKFNISITGNNVNISKDFNGSTNTTTEEVAELAAYYNINLEEGKYTVTITNTEGSMAIPYVWYGSQQ